MYQAGNQQEGGVGGDSTEIPPLPELLAAQRLTLVSSCLVPRHQSRLTLWQETKSAVQGLEIGAPFF